MFSLYLVQIFCQFQIPKFDVYSSNITCPLSINLIIYFDFFFSITGSLDHTEFRIDNEMHRVKIGAPTRELWIDGAWYSVFFDCRPVSIKIGSRSWDVFLEDGAAPIVDIGKVARKDLCLGIVIFFLIVK